MIMPEQIITEEILPTLREWFDFNFSTGCTLEQLKGTLLEAGYGEIEIDGFLAAQSSRWSTRQPGVLFDADPIGSADEAVERYWRRSDLLGSFNRLSLGDRTVCIAAKNLDCGIHFIPDFLSDQECQGLILDAGSLSESQVLDESDGARVHTGSRSSQGAMIRRGATALVRRIESRISKLTSLPIGHGEHLQLLHYEVGGEYRPHFDYFDPATTGGARVLARSSQRLASVILYLCDVEGGGATLFPELSLAFTPMKGAALLFASLGRDGALLQTSLHCGCPVTSGEKWIATKWIRVLPETPEEA
jgi:prolyl 4-hydroxylase